MAKKTVTSFQDILKDSLDARKITPISTGWDAYNIPFRITTNSELSEYIFADVGGLPGNRMTMFVGDADTGKSSLGFEALVNMSKQDVHCLVIETEGKASATRVANLGGDPDRIQVLTMNDLDEVWWLLLELIPKYRDSDNKLLVLVDSISMATTKEAKERGLDAVEKVGHIAKCNNKYAKMCCGNMIGSNCCFMFVNHAYDSMPAYGMSTKVIKGGKEIQHAMVLTYMFTRKKTETRDYNSIKEIIGKQVGIKLHKGHDDGIPTAEKTAYATHVGLLTPDQFARYKLLLKGKPLTSVTKAQVLEGGTNAVATEE